jgi:hypothetical protein
MIKLFSFLLLLHISLYGSISLNNNNDLNLSQEIYQYQNFNLLRMQFTPLNLSTDYNPQNININETLSQPQKKLVEGTLYTQVFMIGTVGLLYLMPESVSKWDKDALAEKSLSTKWKENVNDGPVWDEDDFAINYIGHPVSGAWYYTMARNYGISPEGSFLYSVFLSTCVWEYGYEAFAEIPSWQDLFSTPIVGSLMGEYFYYLEKEIDKNNGEVLDSRILGNISYFLLNPIGNISNGLSEILNLQATLRFQTYQSHYSVYEQKRYIYQEGPTALNGQDFSLVLNIEF